MNQLLQLVLNLVCSETVVHAQTPCALDLTVLAFQVVDLFFYFLHRVLQYFSLIVRNVKLTQAAEHDVEVLASLPIPEQTALGRQVQHGNRTQAFEQLWRRDAKLAEHFEFQEVV